MIEIIHGKKVEILRNGSPGVYRISEQTGRDLKLVTVVPGPVWGKYKSPFYTSFQVPIEDLNDCIEQLKGLK